jgi:phosphoglycolate phosphatase-like HAD superfamily hydrolase
MSAAARNGGAPDTRLPEDTYQRIASHRLWMFDFDNTLAPLEPAVDWAASRRELQAWLAAQGVAPALFEEISRGTLVLYEALRARLAAGGEIARAVLPNRDLSAAAIRTLLDGASKIIEGFELAGVPHVVPAPGALTLLAAIRNAGAKIAVVTSNSSRAVDSWLRAHGARALADIVVGRDRGLALKPSPVTLACALAEAGVSPFDAAFVGDSEGDLMAARAADACFYGVHAKPEGREKLAALGARLIFASPAEILSRFASDPVRQRRAD